MKKDFPPELLTAYVLGQASEAERQQIEAAAQSDAALAAELNRLRQTAAYVKENMGSDAELKLSPARRGALANALARKTEAKAGWRAWASRPAMWGSAAAAALVLVVVWQAGIPEPKQKYLDAIAPASPPATQEFAPQEALQDAPAPAAAAPEAVEEREAAPLSAPEKAPAAPVGEKVGALSAVAKKTVRNEAKENEADRAKSESVAASAAALEEAPAAPEPEVILLPSETLAAKAALAPPPARSGQSAESGQAGQSGKAVQASQADEVVEIPATMVQVSNMHIRITLPPPLEPATERKVALGVARKMKSDEAVLAEIRRKGMKAPGFMITGEMEVVDSNCIVYLSILMLDAEKPITDRRKAKSCAADDVLEAFEVLAADIASRQQP